MQFNSLDFAIFLPVVFVLYWFLLGPAGKGRNVLLLIASYVFYGWWDPRFLALIAFSTVVDYGVGLAIGSESRAVRRRQLLWVSMGVNLGLLFYFKYFNFFIDSFVGSFSFFGIDISVDRIDIILPVGISFYTFQTMSYTIDVYRGVLRPTRDFVAFAAFVSFFPQLVAGPIERATNLLPQFTSPRWFDDSSASDGLRQILWGLVKKVVIADNCAVHVNHIFGHVSDQHGLMLALGGILFAFQIYGDFSGYSDIAIGSARLFGFELMTNFRFPYFSRDIAEFWRRWHISLSTWFRDYLYIPLGGSRGGRWMRVRNTMIIFMVSGAWHGANWTFVAWGALNALYFLPLLLSNRNRTNLGEVAEGRVLPGFREALSMLGTFGLTVLAWIFFRAESIADAVGYITRLLDPRSWSWYTLPSLEAQYLTLALVFLFIAVEWVGRSGAYGLAFVRMRLSTGARWFVYIVLILVLYFFGEHEENVEFIYFQF